MAKNKGGLTLQQAAELFGVLGGEIWLRLLARLVARGQAHAGGLSDSLGMPQSAVSHQLILLRRARMRATSTWLTCRARPRRYRDCCWPCRHRHAQAARSGVNGWARKGGRS
jgi:hypothetical protein